MSNWDYEIYDLLPLVKELAQKYTSKESSSVSYETARMLLEAILYTIRENQMIESTKDQMMELDTIGKMSAQDAYERGCKIIERKMKQVSQMYNEMILSFHSYGNQNYKDTVTEGISQFLIRYDSKFQPQNHLLTLDYPTLDLDLEKRGIDVIEKYLKAIIIEQRFLNKLPKEFVNTVLANYHSDYKIMYFNLCVPILHTILACMIIKKKIGIEKFTQEDYDAITDYALSKDRDSICDDLKKMLNDFLSASYGTDAKEMYRYFKKEMENFASEIMHAVWFDCVPQLFTQDTSECCK